MHYLEALFSTVVLCFVFKKSYICKVFKLRYGNENENFKTLQEDAGRLRFLCHFNDGEDQHMIW